MNQHLIDTLTTHTYQEQRNTGIYMILNKITKKYYIGSASNKIKGFRRRWQVHVASLIKGNHINPHLQYSVNRYGINCLEFIIIEVIQDNSKIILESEQKYIDKYKSYDHSIGYNCLKTAVNTNIGLKRSESTKEKLRKAFLGKPRTLALKQQLGCPVLQYDLNGNFIREFYSLTEAANKTGVMRQDIGKCCLNKIKRTGRFQWKYKDSDKTISKYKPKVLQFSKNGELLSSFFNIKEASVITGIRQDSLSLALRGKHKTSGGFIWKFER